MRLYLMRHGEAVSEKVDPDKSLSVQGAEHVEKIAAYLAGQGLRVSTVWHSGKKRAEQTARIIGRAINPGGGIVFHEGIQPLDPAAPVARELNGCKENVFIASHLPFLNNLAAVLLIGVDKSFLDFGAACLVSLEKDNGVWRLRWMIRPEMLG